MNWNLGCVVRRFLRGWPNGLAPFCCYRKGNTFRKPPNWSVCNDVIFTNGSNGFSTRESQGFAMDNAPADRRSFPPEIALQVVKLACERPDDVGRSLSHWDCAELARQLIADRAVDSISPQTVQRILANHHLKPWKIETF